MKIIDVSMVVHERRLPAGMPLPPMQMSVLCIHTDEGIEDLGYYWYEDPLQSDDIYGYRASATTSIGT